MHYTAMDSAQAAMDRLCDPQYEVSAHYLIAEDGACYEMVDPKMRAWHAGVGSWRGLDDINSRSIGIELANDGSSPFAALLMTALEGLLRQILEQFDLPPKAVIGHSDMAPGRKCDPGRRFDWRRLALQGLAVWPNVTATTPTDADRFCESLVNFGYPDLGADVLLDAFRQRFRPHETGPLDDWDMAAAADLSARFGVDRDPNTA
nr:N-acetylmuramoyl-L-alanine amidase [Pseudaestuariivita rosea]